MIPVRIDRKPEVRDDYLQLGRYIAAAKEKGEKLDKFWIAKCDAGTELADLDTALMEIEATRTLKPGIADKTYHLVVSFHPGEEDKLSLEDVQDIERSFALALGYGDHQRVVGTHINTDNFHMHVAFNKIHPETGRCHTPRQDFKSLAKVCREMERKYGLVVDKGMTDGPDRNPVSRKGRDYEAKTWQQSFERHLVEHKAEIMKAVDGAGTWPQLHKGLEECGVMLRKRGAGLVFAQIDGKGRVKASTIDRSCSLASLEKRLGQYVPPAEKERQPTKPPKRAYRPKPMTRHPGQDRLWRAYTQTKKPSFLGRVLHIRNWKDYLLAEAHRDAMALAIILTYKELFHMLDEATTAKRGPYQPPRTMAPALSTWLSASAWTPPATTWLSRDIGDMDLKADEAGRVLFPFRDDKGHIWAVRAMDGQGATCDVGDTSRPGLSHVIDPGGDLRRRQQPCAGPVVITTDCLSAAALHKDTGRPVVLVPHAAGLSDMAMSIRRQHPDSHIIVAVPAPNRLAAQAASLAGGELVLIDGVQAQAKIIAELASKGRPVGVDALLASDMGAVVEEALSPEEALASLKALPVRQQRDRSTSAEDMGAFVEDALSEEEARSSRAVKPKKSGKAPGIER